MRKLTSDQFIYLLVIITFVIGAAGLSLSGDNKLLQCVFGITLVVSMLIASWKGE
jgi:hypothetical protein